MLGSRASHSNLPTDRQLSSLKALVVYIMARLQGCQHSAAPNPLASFLSLLTDVRPSHHHRPQCDATIHCSEEILRNEDVHQGVRLCVGAKQQLELCPVQYCQLHPATCGHTTMWQHCTNFDREKKKSFFFQTLLAFGQIGKGKKKKGEKLISPVYKM